MSNKWNIRTMTPEESKRLNPLNRMKQPMRLIWEDHKYEGTLLLFSATTPVASYIIVEGRIFTYGEPAHIRISARAYNHETLYTSEYYSDEEMLHKEIEHAKSICQEHFLNLILSCFE